MPVREGSDSPHAPVAPLSPREWEVIRQLLSGLTVGQIAARSGRSLKTISTQKSAAYRKLSIASDNELFLLREYVLSLDGVSA